MKPPRELDEYDVRMIRQKMTEAELRIYALVKLVDELRLGNATLTTKVSELEQAVREIAIRQAAQGGK